MNHRKQIHHFDTEIRKVIERFTQEYDLTMSDAIGALEIIKLDLYRRAAERADAAQNDD